MSQSNGRMRIGVAKHSDRPSIYRLRYQLYSTELRQHQPNDQHILTDALDAFNTYITAHLDERLIGFVSITPPGFGQYSIDKYCTREELPFPVHDSLYEMRILAVEKEYRHSAVAMLLMYGAFRWIEAHGGSEIMAMGRVEVLDLYLKLGFQTVGTRINSGEVSFEVILADVENLHKHVESRFDDLFSRLEMRCEWNVGVPYA